MNTPSRHIHSPDRCRTMARPARAALIISALVTLSLFVGCFAARHESGRSVDGRKGVVVSPHPIASRVGLGVLTRGGNAVDAAVATGLALGVVDQFNSGIGGGGFILIRMADGEVYAVDGRETAPAAAARDLYLTEDGRYEPEMSRVGPLAVGVPGILAAYAEALEIGGTRTLADLIAPSVRIAEEGFTLDAYYMSRYAGAIEALEGDPESAKIYLRPGRIRMREGDVLRQSDLAETYRNVAAQGLDYFYRGGFARSLARYMAEAGGLITLDDMKGYRARCKEPIEGSYGGSTVYGMPPPSSGGVHVVQILNMLEASNILEGRTAWDGKSMLRAGLFMRKAFEDRSRHLGDDDFYPVPVERLVSKEYASTAARQLMQSEPDLGAPRPCTENDLSGHTANFTVVDLWGNAVSVNQTVNLTYGAKVTLPGTGVILNNEMDDFSARPGVPNAFGLIGSEANAIEPGKRPLSSMAPTIVVRGGRPVLVLGGAGGPRIITAVVQVIVAVLDFEASLADALAMPRFHHQFMPEALMVERAISDAARRRLTESGMPLMERDELARVQAIAWDEARSIYVGAADPRAGGGAAAY